MTTETLPAAPTGAQYPKPRIDSEKAFRSAQAVVVDRPEAAREAATLVIAISELAEAVREDYRPIVEAAKRTLDEAKSAMERHTSPLERAEKCLRDKLATWMGKTDRVVVKSVGLNFQEKWDFEIEDENLVPDEFWSIDESKLKKVVTGMKGDTKIPGVRVFSKNVPVVRSAR